MKKFVVAAMRSATSLSDRHKYILGGWAYTRGVIESSREIKTHLLKNLDVDNMQEPSYIDSLITGLKREKWLEDEKPCFDTMLLTLESAKNSTLWAVWMLDSMQVPTGQLYGVKLHLGNYDECLNPDKGFKINRAELLPQYCLADFRLTDHTVRKPSHAEYNASLHTYLKTTTRHGQDLSYLSWGACLPRVCKRNTIPKIFRVLLRNSHLGSLGDSAKISIESCQIAYSKYPTEFLLIILLGILIAVIALSCTFFVNATNNEAAVPASFVRELARSFCLKRNMATLTKIRNDEINSMNVMRLLTCCMIVLYHQIYVSLDYTVANMLSKENVLGGPMIQSTDFLVSTFFTISGLLFMRGLLNDKTRNPLIYIWKRYVRLVAGFAEILVSTANGSFELGDGPVWYKFCGKQKDICKNNLWFNLFMLGNYDPDKLCVPILWYVACDFQLCVLATFIFYIYNKNKIHGVYTFALIFVIGTALPGLLTYWKKYPVLKFYNGVEHYAARNLLKNIVFRNIYIPGHARIGSFMIGMAMGYILYTYKPSNYRNIISKKWSYAGIVAGLWTMWTIMSLAIRYYERYGEYDPIEGAMYVSMNKVVWSIGACIIISISEYGSLPILNDIFAWQPFSVLSRLSYGVYLVHILFIAFPIYSLRGVYNLDPLNIIITTLGVMVCSLCASLLLLLLIEAPLVNINNVLLDRMYGKTNAMNGNTHNTRVEKKKY